MFSEAQLVARNWWVFLVLGAVSVAAGVAVIVWPGKSLLVVGVIAGIYLLLAALLEMIDAVAGPPDGRAVSLILGVLALIAGTLCIRRPGGSLLALVIAVGIYLVAAGVIRVVRAIDIAEGRVWAAVIAAFEVTAGILVLVWPDLGLTALAVMIAATMLVRGLISIVMGLRLRGLRGDDPPPVHTASMAA